MPVGTALILVLLSSGSPATGATAAEPGTATQSSTGVQEPEGGPQSSQDDQSSSPGVVGWLERGGQMVEGGEDSARGFFPLFGAVVARSGLAAGGGYRDDALFGSPLGFEASALFSVRNFQLYRARLGFLSAHPHTLELRPADTHVSSMVEDGGRNRPGVSLYLDGRYRYYPREHFYGLGPASRAVDATNYRLRGGSYDLVMEAQATRSVGFSARVGLLESSLGAGHDPDEPATQERFTLREAPGIIEQPRYLVAGFGVALDTREDAGDPRAGVFLGGAAWRFDARKGRRFDFTRVAFDGRTYFTPRRSPGVVAVRAVVSADLTAPGSEVPFFLAQTLGGSQLLRSFLGTRFRDRALAHGTVEYRVRPHRLIEVAPFIDVGTVDRSLTALRARQLRASVGVGLRPTWKGRVLGRMDCAVGRDGARVVFAIGQAF